MRLDLHMHSHASDGELAPVDVVERAAAGGLDVIAITDHDTTAGIEDAQRAADDRAIDVIAAVEMSSTDAGREIHLLGYFVDLAASALMEHERRARVRRVERLQEMTERLRSQGVNIPFEDVLAVPGADRGNIGRPHLARALVADGHATDLDDAFDRYIGDGHPAFVPTSLVSPFEAVAIIQAAGGLAVWAHPPKDALETLTRPLVDSGLSGLEVYRPNHSASFTLQLEAIQRSYGLLRTGGSDWHGPEDGSLGDFYVTGDEVEAFLDAGGL